MEALSRKPRDYKAAFSRITKNMKLMFVHAFQSLLWNKAVSHRMESGPKDKPIAGDLVLIEDKSELQGGSDSIPTLDFSEDKSKM